MGHKLIDHFKYVIYFKSMLYRYSLIKEIEKYRFNVTIKTDDFSVFKCLCALSKLAQKTGDTKIACPKTYLIDWKKNNHQVTFRFSENSYRSEFLYEATRILPVNLWTICNQNNDDSL
jgi:hypothetical protein